MSWKLLSHYSRDTYNRSVSWIWPSGKSKYERESLEEEWEIVPSEESSNDKPIEEKDLEKEEFHISEKRVIVGFYSLITPKILFNFLIQNCEVISCYWPDDPNNCSRGSIKVFRVSSMPPNWFRLVDLFKLPVQEFRRPLEVILNRELTRLRNLELNDPLSSSMEFMTPCLEGLFLYLPFFVYVWKEICQNPFTDLNIALPLERLYDRTQRAYPWRETVDSIVVSIASRPANFPPIVVHLIKPRLSVLSTEAENQECRKHGLACHDEYKRWFDSHNL